jgi:biotin carboxylase
VVEKQKIMILGAGRDQIPIIKKARQMGFFAIVVSVSGNYPGFAIADKSYEIDVVSKERVLEVAQFEKICGIVTDQLDAAVPTVAYVAEKMGLPGIGYDCALKFTNKYTMRQICEKIGIPVPKHFQAATLDEAVQCAKELDFPFMIKPVDGAGSKGVSKVSNSGELERKFEHAHDYSRSRKVIMEEFFPGAEFAVVGFVINYQYTNLGIGERFYFDVSDLFIPKRTLFPSLLSQDMKDKIMQIDNRLFAHLRPKFGNTYSEYLVNFETGDVRLVETTIRGCGNFTSSDLVPLACGIDVNELLISIASGNGDVKIDHAKRINRASGSLFFHLPEGTIREIRGLDEVSRLPGVYQVHLGGLEVGKQIGHMMDKGDRIGPILISGEDRADLQNVINQIQQTLAVKVETQDGMKGIVW